MTPEEKQAIRERCGRATEGPWAHDEAIPWTSRQRSPFADCGASVWVVGESIPDGHVGPQVIEGGAQDEQGGAVGVLLTQDAEFIAHARTDIPALCDYVEELELHLEILEAIAKEHDRCGK